MLDKKELFQVLLKSKPRFIGIDGLGASGKTELAKKIAKTLEGATIIHTDDFYKPLEERTIGLVPEIISPDFDWDRLEREVFLSYQNPLASKTTTSAPASAASLTRPRSGLRKGFSQPRGSDYAATPQIIIVVGVYALQKRFRKYYDYTIWVDAPREVRIARMIKREGEAVAKEWQEKWLPREERYLEIERPFEAASTIFENTSG